jgi:hypothetical protein
LHGVGVGGGGGGRSWHCAGSELRRGSERPRGRHCDRSGEVVNCVMMNLVGWIGGKGSCAGLGKGEEGRRGEDGRGGVLVSFVFPVT